MSSKNNSYKDSSEKDNVDDSSSLVVFDPAPREEWTLMSQGAEARIWKVPKLNRSTTTTVTPNDETSSITNDTDDKRNTALVEWMICKERFSKSYRHPVLDEKLTKSRCRSEARILEKCAKQKLSSSSQSESSWMIRVPQVLRVEPPLLYLEFLEGPTLKSYLLENKNATSKNDLDKMAHFMGTLIGRLHHNLGVIHGDLTTSNIMVLQKPQVKSENNNNDNNNNNNASPSKENNDTKTDTEPFGFDLVLIDFGLAKSTRSVEEQAVDLYVLERAFQSTHPDLPDDFLDKVLEAYASVANNNNKNNTSEKKKSTQSTLDRLEQVRQRGRKREYFG